MSKHNTVVVVAAMVVIGSLEVVALLKGINGVLLTGVIGIIAGLGGLAIKRPW